MAYSLTSLAVDADFSLWMQLRFWPEHQYLCGLSFYGRVAQVVTFLSWWLASKKEHPKCSEKHWWKLWGFLWPNAKEIQHQFYCGLLVKSKFQWQCRCKGTITGRFIGGPSTTVTHRSKPLRRNYRQKPILSEGWG